MSNVDFDGLSDDDEIYFKPHRPQLRRGECEFPCAIFFLVGLLLGIALGLKM